METSDAATIFDALAHETRLAVYRMLIPVGPGGLPAGTVGTRLGLPANSLSFHLHRLMTAGLIGRRQEGRHLYYAVDYARLTAVRAFLSEDCCAAAPAGCLPECDPAAPPDTTGHLSKRPDMPQHRGGR